MHIPDAANTNSVSRTLTDKEEAQLRDLAEGDAPKQVSRRAQAVLLFFLSGCNLQEVADYFHVHKNSVRNWLRAWEEDGIDGLYDEIGRGAKPIFTDVEEKLILSYLDDEPRSLKKLAALVEKRLKKKASTATLRRILKKYGKRWKRMRKIPKGRPEQEAVDQAKKEIAEFERQEKEGELEIYYFDESGFSLQPSVPYAWQDEGRDGTLGILSSRSAQINVLGFISPVNHKLISFEHKDNVDSSVFIDVIEDFCDHLPKKTVVILDNASIHCSKKVQERLNEWKEWGLELYYIPPYSPKLNPAEILWRKMKYEWIPVWAYFSLELLQSALRHIMRSFGADYDIQFTKYK